MTTEPKIVKRRGKVYVEYDSVGDAFSDVTAYAALRTRLAEAEDLLEGWQRFVPEGRWVRISPDQPETSLFARTRAFLEGSQEVSE